MSEAGKLPKAVTVFAGARDHYQLPIALHEAGLLEALVTDVYLPADRWWFASTVGALLPSRLIAKRFRAALPSARVRLSASSLGLLLADKARIGHISDRQIDEALSRKARALALRTGAALFCYSYYASEALKPGPPYRFLFQLHPHPQSVHRLLTEELEHVPAARASLTSEHELSLKPEDFERLCSEPALANGWVAASRYTAQTLAENGVPREKVYVVPYGVDTAAFPARTSPPETSSPFTVIFVGRMVQRKGLSYLLAAVRLLKTRAVRVLLCGRGFVDSYLIDQYTDLNVEVHTNVSQQELVQLLHASDVFVLPSLVEGFALVILEAMASGLPAIATPNTCGPDVLEEGRHGFIVPIRDAQALAERLAWGIDNRPALFEMGLAAAEQARSFTWERFRQGIIDAYRAMITAASVGTE